MPADLLWASRGGGGNFGVVTTLELDLHPVGPLVLGGLLGWRIDDVDDLARTFRTWAQEAPVGLGTGLIMLSAPPEEFIPESLHGAPVAGLAVLWTGAEAEGHDVIAPMRELKPELDLVGPMPYAGRDRPAPTVQLGVIPWGGAVAAATSETTPMVQRSARWVTHPFATWTDPADDEACIRWAKDFRRDISPHATGGVFLNFVGDEGSDRIAAAFGPENFIRLRQVPRAPDARTSVP